MALRLLLEKTRRSMMRWFNISLVGWLLVIVALAIGARLAGAPTIWIGIGALFLVGIAVIVSAKGSGTQSGPPRT